MSVAGQRRPRLRAAGGVADHAREVADHEDDPVAEVLEVLHLADEDGVAEVEVGSGGVEADLDGERACRAPSLALRDSGGHDVHAALDQVVEGVAGVHAASVTTRRPSSRHRPSSRSLTARG